MGRQGKGMHKRVEKMRYILEKTREAKEQRAVTEDGNPRKHTSSFSSFLLLSPLPASEAHPPAEIWRGKNNNNFKKKIK